MNRKYYKHKESGEIYYIGADQRNLSNLINMRTGSEYFFPGDMWDVWNAVKDRFEEITKDQALNEIPSPYGAHSS